ncbi:MAG: response regulator [Elusimicrobiota bacterium]
MKKKKIAVIDDEPDIVELVSHHLQKSNFIVDEFTEYGRFKKHIKRSTPDLIILDLMLPDADGIEVCREIRNSENLKNIPVIMLTAKTSETERITGLEIGADDYVTKPFSPRELVARVKAVLRRQKREAADNSAQISIGKSIKIEPEKHKVTLKGKKVNFTTTEFKILLLLALKKDRVFSREQILDHLWGYEKVVLDRTVDVHINNIRDKLGAEGRVVKNVRGVGYKIEE